MSTVSINPLLTTTAAGGFSVASGGYIQGTMMDDPAVRNALAGGFLDASEVLPMWGGVGITERVAPTGGLDQALGGSIIRATSVANITGFSVFNQAHAAITTPQSPVPLTPSLGTVSLFRLGSGARIAVACDPTLATLEGSSIAQQVGWDIYNQVLAPYETTATYAITSATATYNNNGTWTVAIVMGVASPVGAVGDAVNISGLTGTGASLVNGNHVVTAFTDNQHFSIMVVAGSGAIGSLAGSGVLNYGTGALACKILKIQTANCMTVQYDPLTGFATWNRNGCCALIQI